MDAQQLNQNGKYLDGLRDDIICFLTSHNEDDTMLSADGYYIKVSTDDLINIIKH